MPILTALKSTNIFQDANILNCHRLTKAELIDAQMVHTRTTATSSGRRISISFVTSNSSTLKNIKIQPADGKKDAQSANSKVNSSKSIQFIKVHDTSHYDIWLTERKESGEENENEKTKVGSVILQPLPHDHSTSTPFTCPTSEFRNSLSLQYITTVNQSTRFQTCFYFSQSIIGTTIPVDAIFGFLKGAAAGSIELAKNEQEIEKQNVLMTVPAGGIVEWLILKKIGGEKGYGSMVLDKDGRKGLKVEDN
ncbi:hypothetical protein BKA69DRAFT_599588 [Paraphysoderma sedebokerense]|nr:hypothetical protein BKA69DRAFT_599588 [Paraphysoderma sedebokerense]